MLQLQYLKPRISKYDGPRNKEMVKPKPYAHRSTSAFAPSMLVTGLPAL